MPTDSGHSREDLIALCEAAIVPMTKWRNRDSASAHEGVGRAWVLLRAGAPFCVRTEPSRDGDRCVTDDNTIWVEIEWRGFDAFEFGYEEGASRDTFYLPTRARLDKAAGDDWY